MKIVSTRDLSIMPDPERYDRMKQLPIFFRVDRIAQSLMQTQITQCKS